jgi:8-oxo-dGTP pyrophosphatase MutT (NUDIX family)
VTWRLDPEALRQALTRHEREALELPEFRRAAVLVPILDTPEAPEVLFTVRSGGLSNHAGQIAFPGGRVDPGETVEETAIRETLEETGLVVPPEALLGRMSDHPSPAAYVVTPVVGLVPWPQELRPNPDEVDECFTVPLAELRTLAPHTEERTHPLFRRKLHFYPYGERMIWGLTGNVLKELLDLLEESGLS